MLAVLFPGSNDVSVRIGRMHYFSSFNPYLLAFKSVGIILTHPCLRQGKSTWESPKGPQISLKDMPSDWDAFKDAKGNIYYANKDTGVSTFDDPRLGPGASVLKLLQTTERVRATGACMHACVHPLICVCAYKFSLSVL